MIGVVTRDEKLTLLAFRCEQMHRYPDDDRFCEWSEKAAELARELFPPMAKPLVWRREQQTQHLSNFGGYTIFEHPSGSKFVARERPGETLAETNSLAEAKAVCESHHQSRFKELLA